MKMKMSRIKQNFNIYKYSYYFTLNKYLIKRLFKTFKHLANFYFNNFLNLKWIMILFLNNSTSLTIKLLKIYFNIFFKIYSQFNFKKYNKIMPFFLTKNPKINLFKMFQRNFLFFGFSNKKMVINFLFEFFKLKLIPYVFIPLNLMKYNRVNQFYTLQQFRLNQIFGYNFENKTEFLNLYLSFITRFFYYLFLLFFQKFLC